MAWGEGPRSLGHSILSYQTPPHSASMPFKGRYHYVPMWLSPPASSLARTCSSWVLFSRPYLLRRCGLPAAKFSQDMAGAGTAARKLMKWIVGQRAGSRVTSASCTPRHTLMHAQAHYLLSPGPSSCKSSAAFSASSHSFPAFLPIP